MKIKQVQQILKTKENIIIITQRHVHEHKKHK